MVSQEWWTNIKRFSKYFQFQVYFQEHGPLHIWRGLNLGTVEYIQDMAELKLKITCFIYWLLTKLTEISNYKSSLLFKDTEEVRTIQMLESKTYIKRSSRLWREFALLVTKCWNTLPKMSPRRFFENKCKQHWMVLHDISKGSVVITLSTLRKCNQKFINYSSSLLGSLFVLLDSNLALNLWRVLKAKTSGWRRIRLLSLNVKRSFSTHILVTVFPWKYIIHILIVSWY